MARLISFGCSITYGQGLSDCFVPPGGGPVPSNYAWPALVSSTLGLENINNGRCASSNQRILTDIQSFAFDQNDIVAILWSYSSRSMLYSDNTHILDVLPKFNDAISVYSEDYYRSHNEYDMFMQTAQSISHANLFMDKKRVTVYNFYFDYTLHTFLRGYPNSPACSSTLKYIPRNNFRLDYALDNMHPGIKSHELIATIILNTIKEKYEN